MNNLLLYCGLVDARISASEKDLYVQNIGSYVFADAFQDGNFIPKHLKIMI